jgi:hypothetical protein
MVRFRGEVDRFDIGDYRDLRDKDAWTRPTKWYRDLGDTALPASEGQNVPNVEFSHTGI